jgi:hypothetical protein
VTEAIKQVHASRPHVITTGLGLPGEDGCSLIAQLKRHVATRDIPIVAVTGYTDGTPLERARRAGCDAVLTKPCLPSRLLAEIQRLLTRGRTPVAKAESNIAASSRWASGDYDRPCSASGGTQPFLSGWRRVASLPTALYPSMTSRRVLKCPDCSANVQRVPTRHPIPMCGQRPRYSGIHAILEIENRFGKYDPLNKFSAPRTQ